MGVVVLDTDQDEASGPLTEHTLALMVKYTIQWSCLLTSIAGFHFGSSSLLMPVLLLWYVAIHAELRL